jgi:phytoene/squalene synthetase
MTCPKRTCSTCSTGLAATRVWGFRSSAALEAGQAPAHACGVAFQLTNILRDILEDAAMGRVYLPREDLAECGVTEADLLAAHGPRVERLFRLFLERAGRFYAAAGGLDPLLSSDGRRAFRAMFGGYASIHRRLARFGRPTPRVRGSGRLRLAAAVLAGVIGGPPRMVVAGSRRAEALGPVPGARREAAG